MDFKQFALAGDDLLDRNDCSRCSGSQLVAARLAGCVFCMLLVVRQRCAGLLRLPVRRNAARSRILLALFRSSGFASRPWTKPPALTRKPIPFAVGVVSHLLRVRHGEASQRRSAMAQLYRHG